MSHAVTASKDAPHGQVHGLTMHPKVRAVIARGLDHEWNAHELAELLGVRVRSMQIALEKGTIKTSRYPSANGTRFHRRALGVSVLMYLLDHSDEITAADVLPIIKHALPLLNDDRVRQIIAAGEALLKAREDLPVVVKSAEPEPVPAKRAANVIAAHAEFSFVAHLTAASA